MYPLLIMHPSDICSLLVNVEIVDSCFRVLRQFLSIGNIVFASLSITRIGRDVEVKS